MQLIAVLLQLCNCIYCHLRTRRKYLASSTSSSSWPAGGATSAPSLPASSPATPLPPHPRPNFPIFLPFFHPVFRALLHQPFSGSAWQRLLRFGGELSEPPVGLPRIHKSSSGPEKILDFVLRQIFLFSSRGDKLSVNPVYVASFQPRIRGNLQFRLIPAHFLPDTGKRKKLLSFHLINTRTGENVTVSHCRQTPALCREEELRNLLFARNLLLATPAPDFWRSGKASWSPWQRVSDAGIQQLWSGKCTCAEVGWRRWWLITPNACQLGRNIQIRTQPVNFSPLCVYADAPKVKNPRRGKVVGEALHPINLSQFSSS